LEAALLQIAHVSAGTRCQDPTLLQSLLLLLQLLLLLSAMLLLLLPLLPVTGARLLLLVRQSALLSLSGIYVKKVLLQQLPAPLLPRCCQLNVADGQLLPCRNGAQGPDTQQMQHGHGSSVW
jgi:hypothetical protein